MWALYRHRKSLLLRDLNQQLLEPLRSRIDHLWLWGQRRLVLWTKLHHSYRTMNKKVEWWQGELPTSYHQIILKSLIWSKILARLRDNNSSSCPWKTTNLLISLLECSRSKTIPQLTSTLSRLKRVRWLKRWSQDGRDTNLGHQPGNRFLRDLSISIKTNTELQ